MNPDVMVLKQHEAALDIYEVENHHAMPAGLVQWYMSRAMEMDDMGWKLTVHVVDRFGHVNRLNLERVYYRMLAVCADSQDAVGRDLASLSIELAASDLPLDELTSQPLKSAKPLRPARPAARPVGTPGPVVPKWLKRWRAERAERRRRERATT